MNEEEAREIIDNMSEQELNDFIFFALQEVEKENQKLKAELKKKDKQIEQNQNILATNDMLHVLECEKKDKMIDLMAETLRYYNGMEQEQCFCIDICGEKECDMQNCKNRIKQYFKEKVEND